MIDSSIFAQVGSDAFLDSLSCVLSLEVMMPGTDCVSQNDASFEMFLMVSGTADVLLENLMDCISDDEEEELIDDEKNREDVFTAEEVLSSSSEKISIKRRRSTDKFKNSSNQEAPNSTKKAKDKENPSAFSTYVDWIRLKNLDSSDYKTKSHDHSIVVSTIGKSVCFGEISFSLLKSSCHCFSLFKVFSLFCSDTNFVYFDQRLGATHAKRWSK